MPTKVSPKREFVHIHNRDSFAKKKDNWESGKLKFSYSFLRFKDLLSQKTVIIGFGLLLISLLVVGGIYSSPIINSLDRITITDTYSFVVIFFSLLNLTLIIFATWKLFYADNREGYTKLELRSGLSKSFMYFYRLSLIFILLVIIIFLELLTNGIFYTVAKTKNENFAYRLFISPLLWLTFISLLGLLITLIFVVIIKTKISLVFSTILGILFLVGAPLSMHWNEIKVSPSLLTTKSVFPEKNPGTLALQPSGLIKDYLTAEKYINLGENFSAYQDFFSVIKGYKDYNFLDSDAIDKLINNPTFGEKFYFYRKLKEINNDEKIMENPKHILSSLKKSGDLVLIAYADLLEKQNLLSVIVKFNAEEEDGELFNSFLDAVNKAKSFFQDYFSFEYGDKNVYYLNSLTSFNKKLSSSKKFNPFYQLNILFFGPHRNYQSDNLLNLNRPLFTQALNIRYDISFERIKANTLSTDSSTDPSQDRYLINSVKVSQNVNPYLILASYGIALVFFSSVIYFAYKPKK